MNKSKGNMYPFVTHTWNPLAGECSINCSYCSTKRLKERYPALKEKYSGPPRIIAKELNNLGKGNFIFVCAQNDLFAPDVHESIILEIHEHMDFFKENTFLLQSKNTKRMASFYESWSSFLMKNMILCTTIESNRVPFVAERVSYFASIEHPRKHITIEPIIDFDFPELMHFIYAIKPEQINIGADSGNNNLDEPSKEKISALIERLKMLYPGKVILKDNLKRIYS